MPFSRPAILPYWLFTALTQYSISALISTSVSDFEAAEADASDIIYFNAARPAAHSPPAPHLRHLTSDDASAATSRSLTIPRCLFSLSIELPAGDDFMLSSTYAQSLIADADWRSRNFSALRLISADYFRRRAASSAALIFTPVR